MKRIEATAGILPMECINPVKDKWRIRFDVQTTEGNSITCMEEEFDHKPTIDEIKNAILTWHNQEIDKKILSGFVWRQIPVWLSTENQFNYKSAYDLAVQTNGASLPVTFKFGGDEPVYHKFESLEELSGFYVSFMQHIQNTLETGWQMKDTFDLKLYE